MSFACLPNRALQHCQLGNLSIHLAKCWVPYPDAFPRPAICQRLCVSSGLHQFIAGASRLGDLYRTRLVPCPSFVRRSGRAYSSAS